MLQPSLPTVIALPLLDNLMHILLAAVADTPSETVGLVGWDLLKQLLVSSILQQLRRAHSMDTPQILVVAAVGLPPLRMSFAGVMPMVVVVQVGTVVVVGVWAGLRSVLGPPRVSLRPSVLLKPDPYLSSFFLNHILLQSTYLYSSSTTAYSA
jgi:hypothetical protein